MKLVVSKSVLYWYWSLRARNGKILCDGRNSFKTKSQAKRAAEKFNELLHTPVKIVIEEE